MLCREQGRGIGRVGRDDIGVVSAGCRAAAVAAIHHAAIPGRVVGWRPHALMRLASAFRMVPALRAGTILGVPLGPVDPRLLVVGRIEIDVLGERHNRHVNVAAVSGDGLELRQQAVGRGFQRIDLVVA